MGKKLNIGLVTLGLIPLILSGCTNSFYKNPDEACGTYPLADPSMDLANGPN